MSQFVRVRPQKVEASDGTIVQVRDREHVEVIKADGEHFVVEVEFGIPTVYLYRNSLKPESGDASGIVQLLVSGLEAMGSTVEVCDD